MIRRVLYVSFAVLLVIALASCGKKGKLDDPLDETVRFPREYPK
jgi:predicted small lipoprotein YifL